jgi:hypothetical protein
MQRSGVFGASALALALAKTALAQTALAQEAVESVVSVEYRAPAECPSRAEFLAQVLRRLPRIRVDGEAEDRRAFEVDLEPAADRTTARLKFLDADSRRVERELSAPSCEEAATGMALITALAIDPRLSITEQSDGAPEPSGPDPSPANPKPLPPVTSHTTATRPGADRLPDTRPKPRQKGWSWSLGAAVGPVSDVAPSWTPSGLVFSELGPASDVRLRLGFGYADSGERELQGGLVRFRLAQGRSELCPVALAMSSRVTLRPCVAFELGVLAAEGAVSPRLVEPKSSTDLWLAGLGALRVELGLSRVVSLELDGQLRVPFLRRSYIFERPEAPVYGTPGVGGGFLLGAKARLLN